MPSVQAAQHGEHARRVIQTRARICCVGEGRLRLSPSVTGVCLLQAVDPETRPRYHDRGSLNLSQPQTKINMAPRSQNTELTEETMTCHTPVMKSEMTPLCWQRAEALPSSLA